MLLIANTSFAQGTAYPAKPVRLVVGFVAGGLTDMMARAFADHASRALGQPFVVDNKPGAHTILAARAVAAPERSALLPQVPTFAQAGAGDFSADAWYGVLAPAGTPAPVVQALERVATAFARSEGAGERLRGLGLEAGATCGPAFAQQMRREVDTYSRIAHELNLQAQ